jgi:hypothetical protein
MKEVTVDVATLLDVIRENRDHHREQFETAIEAWRRTVTRHLENAVNAARARQEYRTMFALPQPEDHTDDYDDVIGMLEMHTEPTVILTTREYRQYVTDDWDWKEHFTRTAATYTAG